MRRFAVCLPAGTREAAVPAAWPMAMHGACSRSGPSTWRSTLTARPGQMRLGTGRGSKDAVGDRGDRDAPGAGLRPYFVERMRTTSLAYRIVPFDPDGAHRDREPSLEAFHVDLDRYGRGFQVALVDSRGDIIDATMRCVRLLDGTPPSRAPVLLALLPLAVGVGVTVARWKITSA